MKLFQKVKEIRSKKGELHFERYAIIETFLFAIYIHKIHKADEDLHLHSHPWSFLAVALKGSYIAVTTKDDAPYRAIKPGTVSTMSRNCFHKIGYIVKGPITTLFFAFGKRKPWHYLVDGQKVESREYRELKNSGSKFYLRR